MSVAIKRKGYGQVEANHLSAQYTGQIYAQLPAQTKSGTTLTPIAQLENGQFLRYDYANGIATTGAGDGEWMLVFNEVKLYDERRQNYKDFVMLASEQADKLIYPRLLKTNVGDIFTTNMVGVASTGPDAEQAAATTLAVGDKMTVTAATGILAKNTSENLTGQVFQVVKEYTLADGQAAVKLQRIQ